MMMDELFKYPDVFWHQKERHVWQAYSNDLKRFSDRQLPCQIIRHPATFEERRTGNGSDFFTVLYNDIPIAREEYCLNRAKQIGLQHVTIVANVSDE